MSFGRATCVKDPILGFSFHMPIRNECSTPSHSVFHFKNDSLYYLWDNISIYREEVYLHIDRTVGVGPEIRTK